MEFIILGACATITVITFKVGHAYGRNIGHKNGMAEASRHIKQQKVREDLERDRAIAKTRLSSKAHNKEPAWMGWIYT